MRRFIELATILALAGCDAADNASTLPVMTQTAHDHYHVHAADVDHGHDHKGGVKLGHDHPHDHAP